MDTNPRMAPILALLRLYRRAMMGLACAMLSAIVAIMGAQVFFRYVLNNSLIWAEEVSGYLLVWISFLFLGAAFERGQLVAVEILHGRVGRRARVVMLVVGYGLALAFLGVIVVYGWRVAEFNALATIPAADFIASAIMGRDVALDLSAFWIYLAVPVGCGLLFLHILGWLVARLVAIWRGDETREMFPESGSAL
jgi:TRAP-type C4-dicarboxylate transport system permease small subunit